jgi:hypothetical protein
VIAFGAFFHKYSTEKAKIHLPDFALNDIAAFGLNRV